MEGNAQPSVETVVIYVFAESAQGRIDRLVASFLDDGAMDWVVVVCYPHGPLG